MKKLRRKLAQTMLGLASTIAPYAPAQSTQPSSQPAEIFTRAPPEGFNPEFPIFSGGFDTYKEVPRQTEFVHHPLSKEFREGTFNLDELLDNAEPVPGTHPIKSPVAFRSLFPACRQNPPFVLVYATSANKDMCPSCDYLRGIGYDTKVKELIARTPQVSLLQTHRKSWKGPQPRIFDKAQTPHVAGIPYIFICANNNGELTPLAEVPSDRWKLALPRTEKLLQQVINGEIPQPVILTEDDFRKHRMIFEISHDPNLEDPFRDRLLVLEGQARFGESHFSVDEKTGNPVFTGDLNDWRIFSYAMNCDDSETLGPESGRRILSQAREETARYSFAVNRKNPSFDEAGNWLNEQLGSIRKLPPGERQRERFFPIMEQATKFTRGCEPPYIQGAYENYLGRPPAEYSYVSDFISPSAETVLEKWAQENGVTLISHKLPTTEEIETVWKAKGLSPKKIEGLADAKKQTDSALARADNLGVTRFPYCMPFDVIDEIVLASPRTFAFVENYYGVSSFVTTLHDFDSPENARQLRGYVNPRVLLSVAEHFQNSGEHPLVIYIPYQLSTLDAHAPVNYFSSWLGGSSFGLTELQDGATWKQTLPYSYPAYLNPDSEKMLEELKIK